MNTNGTSGGDTRGREHRGWAPRGSQGTPKGDIGDPPRDVWPFGMKAAPCWHLEVHQHAVGVPDPATTEHHQGGRYKRVSLPPAPSLSLDPYFPPPKPLRCPWRWILIQLQTDKLFLIFSFHPAWRLGSKNQYGLAGDQAA